MANHTIVVMPYQKALKLKISDLGKLDLKDIAKYTFDNFGERQVDIYLQALFDGMELLTENPCIGHRRDDIPAGYEAFNVEKHVVIFTVRNDALVVARIMHEDWGSKLTIGI